MSPRTIVAEIDGNAVNKQHSAHHGATCIHGHRISRLPDSTIKHAADGSTCKLPSPEAIAVGNPVSCAQHDKEIIILPGMRVIHREDGTACDSFSLMWNGELFTVDQIAGNVHKYGWRVTHAKEIQNLSGVIAE
jgi:hypothetical protein